MSAASTPLPTFLMRESSTAALSSRASRSIDFFFAASSLSRLLSVPPSPSANSPTADMLPTSLSNCSPSLLMLTLRHTSSSFSSANMRALIRSYSSSRWRIAASSSTSLSAVPALAPIADPSPALSADGAPGSVDDARCMIFSEAGDEVVTEADRGPAGERLWKLRFSASACLTN